MRVARLVIVSIGLSLALAQTAPAVMGDQLDGNGYVQGHDTDPADRAKSAPGQDVPPIELAVSATESTKLSLFGLGLFGLLVGGGHDVKLPRPIP
jgi:hypothetical protein